MVFVLIKSLKRLIKMVVIMSTDYSVFYLAVENLVKDPKSNFTLLKNYH